MSKIKLKKRRLSVKELLKKIRTGNDPILKYVCCDCTVSEMDFLSTELISVLNATEYGVGLAAPQIGIPLRAFAIRQILKNQGYIEAYFNPVYLEKSVNLIKKNESCLSYPGIVKDIDRYEWIILQWQDEKGNFHKDKFSDFEARIIQHEMDHLDGVCRVSNIF